MVCLCLKNISQKNYHFILEVILKFQGQSIESSGSNAYPNNFPQFCDLVEELCGGREFK